MARTVIHRLDGSKEVVPSKIVTTLHAGERVVFATAGGGGYGDPTKRDPAAVAVDVADGKVGGQGASVHGMDAALREAVLNALHRTMEKLGKKIRTIEHRPKTEK